MAAAAAAPPVVGDPNPRIGGGNDGDTWWTGGSNIIRARRQWPETPMAHRPTNARVANTIYQSCTAGLPEEQRLGVQDGTTNKGVTWTTWIRLLKVYFEDRGMDTVMRIYDSVADTEVYILDNWGRTGRDAIDNWVNDLRQGILGPSNPVYRLAPCRFDEGHNELPVF